MNKNFWRFIGFLLLILLAVFVNNFVNKANSEETIPEEASILVPDDEEFQIMEYQTMPYEVGKEISKLNGWKIKIILPTKEKTWGAIKAEAKKLRAMCLVKIQEGEAVYFFENQFIAGYLFIVNAYPRCPEVVTPKASTQTAI
ncbi:MAG TPA: hypothetical protein VJB35_06700 [Candidatus Nanoarchaeia archaeon]|nr:hypothetical protein [Candidatus Nanoarchaeia archaeon]